MAKNSTGELSKLRADNSTLRSTIQELTLEISYYKGETKKLEWEKNVLKQDINRITGLFKGWMNSLPTNSTRDINDTHSHFETMAKYPCRSICDFLQLNSVLCSLSSCQPPYFIEYASGSWTSFCGWEASDVLGLTCAFLQGEMTDVGTTQAFLRSVQEVGYGQMRIKNYKKNNDVFDVTVTVYPVFDTKSPVGPDSDRPVLTHFATLWSDIVQNSSARHHPWSTVSYGEQHNTKFTDRRIQSKVFEAKFNMSAEKFYKYGESLRLSNLMRLMISCVSALVLTDIHGRIIHTSKGWCSLTGYELSEVEGKCCGFLHGSMTEKGTVREAMKQLQVQKQVEMTVCNYKKDGTCFRNRVIIISIHGGYTSNEVTHYCALLKDVSAESNTVKDSIPKANEAVVSGNIAISDRKDLAINNDSFDLKDEFMRAVNSLDNSSSFSSGDSTDSMSGSEGDRNPRYAQGEDLNSNQMEFDQQDGFADDEHDNSEKDLVSNLNGRTFSSYSFSAASQMVSSDSIAEMNSSKRAKNGSAADFSMFLG